MTGVAVESPKPPFWLVAGIDFRNLIWVVAALGLMIYAIAADQSYLLRFIHVATGVLLTGADILLGFLVGPVVRGLDFEARRRFTLRFLPKTLFIMTTLGIIAPTSGWFLAEYMGYTALDYPPFWWVVAALAISAVMAIQGLFVLLPTNVRVYLEMRKERPDGERVGRMMRKYFNVTASQGVMQVTIVVIMTRFAAGI